MQHCLKRETVLQDFMFTFHCFRFLPISSTINQPRNFFINKTFIFKRHEYPGTCTIVNNVCFHQEEQTFSFQSQLSIWKSSGFYQKARVPLTECLGLLDSFKEHIGPSLKMNWIQLTKQSFLFCFVCIISHHIYSLNLVKMKLKKILNRSDIATHQRAILSLREAISFQKQFLFFHNKWKHS